ncbi:MAG: hypothetical protein FD147_324 [Chloroflexi bacterium]|nr:MAG: hypothetical protein FD147_324 [Chloroflexota bacterium]
MGDDKSLLTPQQHREIASTLFNQVWDLMVKTDRSIKDDEKMLKAAHASRYLWGEVGNPENFTRGEWQLTRVYSLLNRAEPTLHLAMNSLNMCETNHIGDFDLAFAYEAHARGHARSIRMLKTAKDILILQKTQRKKFRNWRIRHIS